MPSDPIAGEAPSNQGRLGEVVSVFRELWHYRDLLRSLVSRDLAVRYRRSALGFVWSLLNPLLMMLVFTIVFQVVKPQSVQNYPLFVLAGMLPWNFLAGAISGATRSVTGTWPIPGGGSPDMGNVSADGKYLWLSGRYDHVVYRIDTSSGAVDQVKVGREPHGLTVWPQPGRYSLGHTGNLR